MANSILSSLTRHRQQLPVASAIWMGAAVASLQLISAAPARAGECRSTQPNISPNNNPVFVEYNGEKYAMCIVNGMESSYREDLQANPWWDPDGKKGGSSIAEFFANAMTSPKNSAYNTEYLKDTRSLNLPLKKNDNESSPYFLWGEKLKDQGNGRELFARAYEYNDNSGKYTTNSSYAPSPDSEVYYFLALKAAPGPLPLLGAGAAFGWSRRLRRRLKSGQSCATPDRLRTASSERLPAQVVFCDAEHR